jgi:phospholipid/cholesterol/gamma-HCH transport system substrate-binding protein
MNRRATVARRAHRAPSRRGATTGRRLSGVAFLLIPALLVWLSVAVYNKEFTQVATVTLETDAAGNEMRPHADVKLLGVTVGEVREIRSDGGTARLTLALDPDKLHRIPADVSAQLLPTTLFGERYVALIPPERPGGTPLAAGSVIGQDRSANAVELGQVLDHVMPTLSAVKPEKLAATLSAVAQALDGRGTQLGETLVRLDNQLTELNPQLPALNEDIRQLVEVSRLYADVNPELLRAMADFTTTSATVAQQRENLGGLYAAVTGSSRDLTTFLRQNQANIIRLSAASRPTLELLAEYAPSFPCTLRTLADFVPVMDRALGKGSDRPGLQVDLTVVPSRGAYRPGTDTPRYDADGGPACYGVPMVGTARAAAHTGTEGALGLPNSPQENALVNELLAAGRDGAGRDDRAGPPPDWSSVLAGPVYRGTEVNLR